MRRSASVLHHDRRDAAEVCWEHARSLLSLYSIWQWSNCMDVFQFGCKFIKELIWQGANKSTKLPCFCCFVFDHPYGNEEIMSCNLSGLYVSKDAQKKIKPFFLYLKKNSCCRYLRFTCEELIIICTCMTPFSAFNTHKSLPPLKSGCGPWFLICILRNGVYELILNFCKIWVINYLNCNWKKSNTCGIWSHALSSKKPIG